MSYSSHPLDYREGQRNRLNASTVKITRTVGFVVTHGAGEGLVDVVFGNRYIEKPALSLGGELMTPALTVGSYPTVSVVVVSWATESKTTKPELGPQVYYLGAKLAIVTTGPPTQDMVVHWQVEGKALAGPTDTATGTGTA